VATASLDGTVRLWNADGSGTPVVLAPGLGVASGASEARIMAMRFSPDGSRVLVASRDGKIRLWDTDGPGQPNTDGPGQPVVLDAGGTINFVAVSADFSRVAVAPESGSTVILWRLDEQSLARDPAAGRTEIISRTPGAALALSPDGSRLAIGASDRGAEIWVIDRPDGGPDGGIDSGPDGGIDSGPDGPLVLPGHGNQPCVAVAFSPDGTRVVTASWDDNARVWSAERASSPVILRGHRAEIRRVAFSPDGERVLTVSRDGTARIWNADGSGLPVIIKHQKPVHDGRFSRDGSRVVTASSDGTARVSLVPPGPEIRAALRRVSNYCIPVPVRRRLLGVSEQTATRNHALCQQRLGRD